jgi:4'-phosphopantetheinyl transferase
MARRMADWRLDQDAVLTLLLPLAGITARGWAAADAALSPEERARAGRFMFDRDRDACRAAHGLKRVTLARLNGVAPSALDFVVGPRGKPALGTRPALRFNLSHCHGLVALAVSRDREVGVDVEFLGRRRPLVEALDRYFGPAERAWLATRPPAEFVADFLRLWTLKEAAIKATGDGLYADLDSFDVDPVRPALLRRPAAWPALALSARPVGADHVAALAVADPPARWRWDAVELSDFPVV